LRDRRLAQTFPKSGISWFSDRMNSYFWLWWFPTHSPEKGEWMGHGKVLLQSVRDLSTWSLLFAYIPGQESFFPRQGDLIMPDPVIAQKGPYPVAVEAGKSYFWCACGRSANQPFCDGSHKGTGFTPTKYEATESETVYFCGCKHTASPCMCDGSHAKL
jgi:CDGSH-type Zn-finger protein